MGYAENLKYAVIAYLILYLCLVALFGAFLMASEFQAKSNSSPWVRKRSDIDIMANILSEANKGTKKTRIMYRCNLSHSQLQVYLDVLRDMGFLASHSKKEGAKLNYFKTTSKGLRFLDAYHALKNLMT